MVALDVEVDWGRTGWIAAGAVLALVVLWVLYSFVGTFVFALFIYYSTRRVHGHIHRRVGQPTVSALLALFLLALPGILLLSYASAIALQEFQAFSSSTDLGEYVSVAGPYANASGAVQDPGRLVETAGGTDAVQSIVSQATAYLGFIATGLLHLFVMFAVAFYLLRDDHRLAAWFTRLDADGGVLEQYARAVDDSLERIFAGNILNAVVTGTVGAITYSLINLVAPPEVAVPYAALMGLLAGFASLIPVVGMKLVYVPVAGYMSVLAYTEGSGWGFVALFVLVSFVVVDVIPDFFVRPYVTGGTLHTGSLMFAYILGPLLFGWYGLFLGPVILVLVTHFGRIVMPRLVDRKPDRPGGIDPPYLPQSVASVEQSLEGTTSADADAGDSDASTANTEPSSTSSRGREKTSDARENERSSG